jgi:hypothetical protein
VGIELELKRRELVNKEYIDRINEKISTIFNIQKQSQYLVKDIHRRLDVLEEILGGH